MNPSERLEAGIKLTDVALLGAGNMGWRIAQSLQRLPEVRIRYVYSRSLSRAERLSKTCGAIPLDRQERIFEDAEVPIVFDCLPTFLRWGSLQKCVASAKHVFCEKPLALNEAMAGDIRQCLSGYGRIVTVGQVLRFFWEYARIRQMVLAEEVGQVGSIRLSRCVGYPGADSWFADREKSGGVILDLLIHDLDFLRWTCGEAKTVFAQSTTASHAGKLEYALLNIQLESGAIAHLEGSWAHPAGSFQQTVEICGSRGMLSYDSLAARSTSWLSTAKIESAPESKISLPPIESSDDPYFSEVAQFIDAVRGKREPAVTWEDALRSCELAFAALESVRLGQPVYVPLT
ncbi:MAG: Gfo/Idh/MocA family oxidoreductase [Terriglobia bacterium]